MTPTAVLYLAAPLLSGPPVKRPTLAPATTRLGVSSKTVDTLWTVLRVGCNLVTGSPHASVLPVSVQVTRIRRPGGQERGLSLTR